MASQSTSLQNTSLVFFGSGPVAAASLQALQAKFQIEAIVTKPVTQTEMQQIAPDVRLYTVNSRQELTELINQKPFASSLGVIVDFGIIVEKAVIDYFALGIVNSHFSLLPRWRGADPISFAILSGDTKTGVSLMLIEEKLDTGKLIAQKSLAITPDDTTPSLTRKLIELSNQLLADYLPRYIRSEVKPHAQPHSTRATYSRKLTKQDGLIDWQKPAEQIEREIRAFTDWPKSSATLAGKEIIITQAHAVPSNNPEKKPGDMEVVSERGILMIECGQGYLCLDRLKPAGKNEMTAAEFIRGYLH